MQEILQANYDGDSLNFQCGDQKVLRTGPWKWKVLHDFDWASHLLCLCWISCWNKQNLVGGPGGERKPKWPQSACLCSLSSRRLCGWSHSGELIQSEFWRELKGKIILLVSPETARSELGDDPRHEIHSSFKVKLKFEVCSCLHSPDKMILKKRSAKFKSRAVHEFHVLRTFWFRLVYGALRNMSCFSLHIPRLLLLGAPNVKNPSRPGF